MQIVFIDARTKRNNYRITAFAESIEELAREFQQWAKECKITQKDIWYAEIFECGSDKHIATAALGDEYEVRLYPKNDKLSPYGRSLKQILSFFKRW